MDVFSMKLQKIKTRKAILLLSLLGCFLLLSLSLFTAIPWLQTIDQDDQMLDDDLLGIPDPKVVHPSTLVDADGDKIDDDLANLVTGKVTSDFALQAGAENVRVCICVNRKPDAALLRNLRNLGAEVLGVYEDLIYAVYANLPLAQVGAVAAEADVTFVEKEYESKALLDTSTINMGARGSSYVWDAVPTIKGNPYYSVAIVDTGVDNSHTDLSGKLLHFRDFTLTYPNGTVGYDYGHHGTHCASIATGTGAADTNPQTVSETISGTVADSGIYLEWFEVKDDATGPSTSVTLNWDNSGGASIYFDIMDSDLNWVTDNPAYTTTPITYNLGNLAAGTYLVYIEAYNAAAEDNEYVCTITHESAYTLAGDSVGTPVYAGVAPQSKLVALKVLDDTGSGTDQELLDALTWILNNGKNTAYNITTVSMSLGFDSVVTVIDTAVNNLVAAGFICVAAAGNDGTTYPIYSPGTAQKCITVGAVNDAFQVCYYSSNGGGTYNKPDVVAPGGTVAYEGTGSIGNEIVAADSNDGESETGDSDAVANDYTGMQGTSMACPHVAGLAQLVIDAMIQTKGGNWTWSEANALRVKQLICMGTWEVAAGETFDGDDDGVAQSPTLDRVGRDNVEGFGMVRADAVIQSITHSATDTIDTQSFYLDRRGGVHARDPKVVLFSFEATADDVIPFTLKVPATGDFDLIIYEGDYDASTGRPTVIMTSVREGLGRSESIKFIAPKTGTYFWSIRAAEGYGTCQLTTNAGIPGYPMVLIGLFASVALVILYKRRLPAKICLT
ncbi:MAG: peptidase S8 and S53, subtilisin, kexin, sedolisin [Promethearchaeota archaeon CR_4]|nr:MAG: peptidase S8 and S53, subtilisin, kexin, sedolisin [Candidatus Lokiarchaeota archaeon CR_4]